MVLAAIATTQRARAAADSPAETVANASQSTDQRLLAGLRQRRLLGLAESHCKRRLSEPGLAPQARAELSLELARTFAVAALDARPQARAGWWERAHQVVVDFSQRETANPFVILVEFEDARIWIDQAEAARIESQSSQAARTSGTDSRAVVRFALRALSGLDARLASTLRRHGRGRPPAEGLSREQSDSLQKHIAYQTARALRSQGQCYMAGTPDRTNSLQQALERLAPLAELAVADHLIWRSRLDRITCYRLLGNAAQARQRAAQMLKSNPPPAFADAARAEQIRGGLAVGQIDVALTAAATVAATSGSDGANLELARLEAMIAAWRRARQQADVPATGRLAKQAADQVQRIEQRLSAYWMRRAETIMAQTMASSSVDVNALKRAAQGFYRSGDLAQAEATYDRLAKLASDQGQTDQAFAAAYTAATIQHDLAQQGSEPADQLSHHRHAMDRYGKLAKTFSDHPRAAGADLLAIYHAAEIARKANDTHRQDALDHYAKLIDAHLQQWPGGATAGQVRLWLGRLRQAQQDWEKAIDAYLAIDPDHAQFEPAVNAIVQCYGQWLAERSAAGEDVGAVALAACTCYRQLLGQLQTPTSDAVRACQLALARTLLDHGNGGDQEARDALTAALAQPSLAPGDWQTEARTLLVFALAGQRLLVAARDTLDQIGAGPAEPIVALAERLARHALGLPDGPDRRALADLAIRAVAIVPAEGSALQGEMARRFHTVKATALAAADRRQEAIRGYTTLVAKYPDDADVQQALAELLGESTDPADLERALATWRTVQRISPVASRRWFLARYGQAQILVRQGAKAKAAKLIEVTQVLHPSLGGPAQRSKFQRLLHESKRQ